MRVLKTIEFDTFANKNKIRDPDLLRIAARMESGVTEASLGAGVYKHRLARAGQGKSGGYRVILFFRARKVLYFVAAFAKKDQENLTPIELKVLKKLAKEVLSYGDKEISKNVEAGEFVEITSRL